MNRKHRIIIGTVIIHMLSVSTLIRNAAGGVGSTDVNDQTGSELAPGTVSLRREHDPLVVWWKFDGDTSDSAGTCPGIVQGNPDYGAGRIGQAIKLDGDTYVDFGNPSCLNFGTGDWTVCAWIKTTQTGTDNTDEGRNRGTVFANGADQTGGVRYALILNETSPGRITLTTDDDSDKIQVTARTTVNDEMWHHIAGMRQAGRLRIYVDGKLDGTSFVPNNYDLSGVSQHHASIGAIRDNRDNSLFKHFVGLIDDVCVFARALAADRVGALYSGTEPITVAAQAGVGAAPPSRLQQTIDDETVKKLMGDWDATVETLGQDFVIHISENADGVLVADAMFEGPDDELMTLAFDEVTFANGRLRLQAMTIKAIFEGTVSDDGSIIEGQWQQQGRQLGCILKRVTQVQDTEQDAQTQRPGQIRDKSNWVTTWILVLILVGVVTGVVVFIMKSSR